MPRAPTKRVSRNPILRQGVEKYGRSEAYHRKGLWALAEVRKNAKKTKPEKKVTERKTVPFGKNGSRVIRAKLARNFSAEPVKKQKPSIRAKHRAQKLRASLKPGTILILIAGRYRGRRVVFLKQMPSGTLLITGPFKFNGIPLRRVNPAYAIATSTKIDISQVKINEKITDNLFKRNKSKRKSTIFKARKVKLMKKLKQKIPKKKESLRRKFQLTKKFKELQKSVDTQLLPIIRKVPSLIDYLRAPFTLRKGQFPHLLKF
eukprot:TRINITY_DN220_c0_g3_i2.p1 TRINITY_DN220_c0_g3~~TRINITY_DN220_c0_g3_i2.p1  ORF type:complete len:261 (+),score=130.07 TRINITY_DN220_c0_g3_i2:239-1021(+)